MSEFVVGQWVEWRDDAVMVVDMQPRCGLIGVDINGERRWVQEENVKPFAWQVGRTYRTTLEGYTATIVEIEPNTILGNRSDDTGRWRWNKSTGRMGGCEKLDIVPHLIPYLADEPSEARDVEAVKQHASSPYDRVIGGVEVDLWTLADIYGITSHRLFSAWKKITMAGRRGPKDKLRDLREARVGLDKEIAKLEAEGGE